MDVSSIAGAANLAQSSQLKQSLSVSMIKQNAEAQNKVAEMLQKGAQAAPQPSKNSDYGFSAYA